MRSNDCPAHFEKEEHNPVSSHKNCESGCWDIPRYLKDKEKNWQSWSASCETRQCLFKVTFQQSKTSVLIEHDGQKLVQNTANT